MWRWAVLILSIWSSNSAKNSKHPARNGQGACLLYHLVVHPLAVDEANQEADTAENPVAEHTQPDTGQTQLELQHKDIAQNHAEQPHTDDADRHGVFGITARPQGVG